MSNAFRDWLTLPWKMVRMEQMVLIYAHPQGVNEVLLELIQSKSQFRWRLAYLLDQIHDQNPLLLDALFPELVSLMQREKDYSVLRHLTRVVMQHPNLLPEFPVLFDECIRLLLQPDAPVAVKANCLTILNHYCKLYPELNQELQPVLEQMLLGDHCTPGIRSRIRNSRYLNISFQP